MTVTATSAKPKTPTATVVKRSGPMPWSTTMPGEISAEKVTEALGGNVECTTEIRQRGKAIIAIEEEAHKQAIMAGVSMANPKFAEYEPNNLSTKEALHTREMLAGQSYNHKNSSISKANAETLEALRQENYLKPNETAEDVQWPPTFNIPTSWLANAYNFVGGPWCMAVMALPLLFGFLGSLFRQTQAGASTSPPTQGFTSNPAMAASAGNN
jgi:hypothetical protein